MRDEASHCTAQIFTVQRIGEFKTYIIELFDHIARSRRATLQILDAKMLSDISLSPCHA